MTLAAITRPSKTTHNTSTLNTGKRSSNHSVKLSLSPHKSSHETFLDSLTVDLFKIPDVNQRLKRRHTAPAFGSCENCSFIRLNDAFRKTLLKAAKKKTKTTQYESRVQPNTRADLIIMEFI